MVAFFKTGNPVANQAKLLQDQLIDLRQTGSLTREDPWLASKPSVGIDLLHDYQKQQRASGPDTPIADFNPDTRGSFAWFVANKIYNQDGGDNEDGEDHGAIPNKLWLQSVAEKIPFEGNQISANSLAKAFSASEIPPPKSKYDKYLTRNNDKRMADLLAAWQIWRMTHDLPANPLMYGNVFGAATHSGDGKHVVAINSPKGYGKRTLTLDRNRGSITANRGAVGLRGSRSNIDVMTSCIEATIQQRDMGQWSTDTRLIYHNAHKPHHVLAHMRLLNRHMMPATIQTTKVKGSLNAHVHGQKALEALQKSDASRALLAHNHLIRQNIALLGTPPDHKPCDKDGRTSPRTKAHYQAAMLGQVIASAAVATVDDMPESVMAGITTDAEKQRRLDEEIKPQLNIELQNQSDDLAQEYTKLYKDVARPDHNAIIQKQAQLAMAALVVDRGDDAALIPGEMIALRTSLESLGSPAADIEAGTNGAITALREIKQRDPALYETAKHTVCDASDRSVAGQLTQLYGGADANDMPATLRARQGDVTQHTGLETAANQRVATAQAALAAAQQTNPGGAHTQQTQALATARQALAQHTTACRRGGVISGSMERVLNTEDRASLDRIATARPVDEDGMPLRPIADGPT